MLLDDVYDPYYDDAMTTITWHEAVNDLLDKAQVELDRSVEAFHEFQSLPWWRFEKRRRVFAVSKRHSDKASLLVHSAIAMIKERAKSSAR